ncbi:MAG: tRNA lysidine(34) synthetase TilS [Desulfobacterales bacterium]|nr:tRNA lysidine(34) synthetase TilS [Desulfobacterales bacterium]MDJ0989873.1 tRNA lysidine(34) synthetase TilS [Desulfobacterales bacterium]
MIPIVDFHLIENDPLVRTVRATLASEAMRLDGEGVLVGVSGGRDSMVLLAVLAALAGPLRLQRLGVAHYHHGLRGAAAGRDAGLVEQTALSAGLPYYYARGDVAAHRRRRRMSLEEAARELRYAFFETTAHRHGFGHVALGHHADDNAELVLMRMLRGSGPRGLAGIPPVRRLGATGPTVIRPLIAVDRAAIDRFGPQYGLASVEDESNRSPQFTRNRIRHDLLPKLRADYNPAIAAGLNRLSRLMRDEERWLETLAAEALLDVLAAAEEDAFFLDHAALGRLHPALQRRVLRAALKRLRGDLRRIGFERIEAVRRLAASKNPTDGVDLPGGVRAALAGHRLCIGYRRSPDAPVRFEYTVGGIGMVVIQETGARLHFTRLAPADVDPGPAAGQSVAYFDMNHVGFPMTIRNFRPGDRFAPFGLKGTQKLKKFFIDHKIPRAQRPRFPLLVSRGEILWVAGLRRCDGARVGPRSTAILKVELLVA